jgi:hypothetical protein
VLALACVCACGNRTDVTTRVVTTYVPQACPVTAAGYATYAALGDYAATPPATGHLLSAVGTALTEIDTQARELVIDATQGSGVWQGVGPVPPAGDVNVLVLPALASCALTGSVGMRAGPTFSPIGSEEALVVGGTSMTSTPPTYVVHLDTGAVAQAAPDLLTARTLATVTPFGEGQALVAAGIGGSVALPNAEIYSVATGGFTQQPIDLGVGRSQQGATVLAGGQTLLVGGVGDDNVHVLGTMLTIDPSNLLVTSTGLAALSTPRSSPTVMRLANGEILVAGGFDGNDAPVPWLEWFNATATAPSTTPFQLVTGSASAFIALEQGGALAVIAPPAGAPANFQNVWLIDSSHVVTAAMPIAAPLTQPALFGGAEGAPVLWTGSMWLQWQPWSGSFGALGVLDANAPNIGGATCSPDPGLAMWLDATTFQPVGLRFDTTNAYSTLGNPFLDAASDAPVAAPVGLAPDGLPSDGTVTYSQSGSSSSPNAPSITLASGGTVWVTDRTYADVNVVVNGPSSPPAVVVLRDDAGNELDVGAAACVSPCVACPLPATNGSPNRINLTRQGGGVTFTLAPGPSGSCPAVPFASTARISLGFRAQAGTSSTLIDALTVTRLGTP